MGDPVVHFEVNGPDGAALAKFYDELFGWKAQEFQGGYFTVDTHAGGGINGGIGTTQDGGPGFVTFYVLVPDLQAALDRAESLGGSTAVPIVEMEMVTFALLSDPQGNRVGLVAPGQGEAPPVTPGDGREVSWWEILSPNPGQLLDFYRELFGWKVTSSTTGDFEYHQIDTDSGGSGIQGGIGGTPDGQPHVNVYADVDDLQKYCERAESLGGTVVVQPMKVAENTEIAMFLDPEGNAFGIFKGM